VSIKSNLEDRAKSIFGYKQGLEKVDKAGPLEGRPLPYKEKNIERHVQTGFTRKTT
jgi:hypothetical protein